MTLSTSGNKFRKIAHLDCDKNKPFYTRCKHCNSLFNATKDSYLEGLIKSALKEGRVYSIDYRSCKSAPCSARRAKKALKKSGLAMEQNWEVMFSVVSYVFDGTEEVLGHAFGQPDKPYFGRVMQCLQTVECQ